MDLGIKVGRVVSNQQNVLTVSVTSSFFGRSNLSNNKKAYHLNTMRAFFNQNICLFLEDIRPFDYFLENPKRFKRLELLYYLRNHQSQALTNGKDIIRKGFIFHIKRGYLYVRDSSISVENKGLENFLSKAINKYPCRDTDSNKPYRSCEETNK